jgi:excisionase family DNA binding protein
VTRLLDAPTAAALLGTSEAGVRRLVRRGALHPIHVGRRVLFGVDEVTAAVSSECDVDGCTRRESAPWGSCELHLKGLR